MNRRRMLPLLVLAVSSTMTWAVHAQVHAPGESFASPSSESSAASQPMGAASQPAGAASQPAGASSQPVGAASQPVGAASQPADASSQSPASMPAEPSDSAKRLASQSPGRADHDGYASHDHKMEHFESDDGGQVMVMGGIPTWLFLLGVALILLLSFVAVERFGTRPPSTWRYNLIKSKRAQRFMKSRWIQAIPQLLMVALFFGLIYAGLFGSRARNVTPVAVWTIWWAGLIFAVALAGPLFCFACPWDGLSNLMTRLRLKARVEPISLGFEFPSWARNLYPAIVAFTFLTWLELGFGVTTDPAVTAYMGLGMAGLAVACALLFNGKSFCHYVCPVGRISGIYSNFSPVEIRARNLNVCAKCTTEDCKNGNERGYPCPTGISLKVIQDSSYCTMCTECIKSCDKQNVAINIRAFGSDLPKPHAGRLDEAWLALSLLSLTLFHGLSMTPAWENFRPGGESILKWMSTSIGTPRFLNFTVGMFVIMAIPVLLYALSAYAGSRLAKEKRPMRVLFIDYARSILPVALFYHLAHNAMHLFMEGQEIIPLLSDPLGLGTDYFGTRGMHPDPWMGEQTLWFFQVGLILIGHVFGIIVAHRISRRLYTTPRDATMSLIPMLGMMIILSVCGLGLMYMDMNMRVGRM